MYAACSRTLAGAALAISLLGARAGNAASAQPALRVRGGCQLQLAARHDSGAGGLAVSGALLDDLGEPIAGRTVRVEIPGGRLTTAVTDAEGEFVTGVPAAAEVGARWDGDPLHSGCETSTHPATGRYPVQIAWGIPAGATFDLSAPSHALEVLLSSEVGGAGLRVDFRFDDGRTLGRSRTDAQGRARLTVSRAALGTPRAAQLQVSTPGDGVRVGAEASTALTLRGHPAVTLVATPTENGQTAMVEGVLDVGGDALSRRAVSVQTAAGAVLATLQTDSEGRFEAVIDVPPRMRDGDGAVALQASFVADAPWLSSASSEAVQLTLAIPETPSPLWLLAPALLSLWLLRRVAAAMRYEVSETQEDGARRARRAEGLSRAGPGTRTAPSLRVSGRVVDAGTGAAIAGAELSLAPAERPALRARSDADGAFTLEADAAGDHTLSASKEGYRPASAPVQLPHRGELLDVSFGLKALRNIAYDAFRPVGDGWAGRRGAAGLLTPRELRAQARERGVLPAEAAELAAKVEAAAYGATAPTPDMVTEIEAAAAGATPPTEGEMSEPEDGGGRRATIPHRR